MRPLHSLALVLVATPAAAQITSHTRSVAVDSSVYEIFFDGTDSANDSSSTTADGAFGPELDATSIVPFMSSTARAGMTSDFQSGAFDLSASGFASAAIYVQGTGVADADSGWSASLELERSGVLALSGALAAGTTFDGGFALDPHGSAAVVLRVRDEADSLLLERSASLSAGQFTGQSLQLDDELELPAGLYTVTLDASADDSTSGIEEVVGSLAVAEFDVDLELLPSAPLAADVPSVDPVTGGAQNLSLDAGPAFAGQVHLVVGSASGTQPGVPFGAVVLPLVPDAYLTATLELANTAPFVGTLGVLDAQGQAQASIELPAGAPSSLSGLTLHHAFLAVDAGGSVTFASNAVALQL